MTTPLRIALFIDAQNAYRRARDRFFPNPQSNVDGQFDPVKLGQLIASRGGPGGMPCSLSDVRIYSGRPDPNRDKRSHAAHMRQSNRWRANGATVVTQGLRYPPTSPTDPAQEKGIDVALAIDFVRLAITGAYDVGVMMSTDTDLLPALIVQVVIDALTGRSEFNDEVVDVYRKIAEAPFDRVGRLA